MAHIDTDNYTNPEYDDKGRFISYYYQVKYITACRPGKVLEVGVGNKTLVNYLRQQQIDIETCDADEKLGADYTGDIRDLPFKDNSYDVVCAFQILEHLPWEEVDRALAEMGRISRKHVIISVPYTALSLEAIFRSSLLYRLFHKWELRFSISFDGITPPWKYDGVHYWEMGKKNYSRRKVRRLISRRFKISKEKKTDLSYQYFFILEKK